MADTAEPWRRSSRCETHTCVQVGLRTDLVLVRDGKDPAGAVLALSPRQWRSFCAAIRAGVFEG